MSSLDILFWLLIAMLGGVAWAMEAGLANKHRRLLLSSTAAALGSVLFIMFWIEDNSKLELGPRAGQIERKKAAGDGQFNYTGEQGGGKQQGGGGASSDSGAASASGAQAAAKMPTPGDAKSSSNDASKTEASDSEQDPDSELTNDYSKIPFKDCPHCPEMVVVPSGTFTFGSAETEPGRSTAEHKPIRLSIEKPFAVSRLEILRSEFAEFVKQSGTDIAQDCDVGSRRRGTWDWRRPGFEQDNRHPVVCIRHENASQFVGWLSGVTGRKYTLLSEAEWEYMARANSAGAYASGDRLLTSQANFGRTRDGSVAGGSLSSNGFGLADVHGNVAEMTADCADSVPSGQQGPCSAFVVKGGAWNSNLAQTRLAARDRIMAGAANNYTGFRVMRALDESDDDKRLTVAQKRSITEAEKAAAEIEKIERKKAETEAAAKKDAKKK
ncbi:MAG: formylglycine-generating enzyme family protein [Hyphomicrobiaceae bacterium]